MKKTYVFPYGHGTQSFELDDRAVAAELHTADCPVIPPERNRATVLETIRHPIGTKTLDETVKPGDTAAFICNDLTRVANSFDFMPVFLDEMNRLGVPDENMTIVFALGAHRDMTPEEMAQAVGEDVARRVKMVNSQAKRTEEFEYVGTTSRGTPVNIHRALCHVDHVFLTGTVVQHYFAGYGGGRKAVLPGCSSLETITANHRHMMDPACGLGITTGNPCYEDQVEGVRLFARARHLFLFNAVLNAHHEFLAMFAGDFVKAHLAAAAFSDKVYGAPIPKKADLVIASCGGYPKDINIYQMQKTMDNARCAVKEGGVVIVLAQCPEGAGNDLLVETYRRLKTFDKIEAELRANFRMGANKAFAIGRNMQHARYILVTDADRELVKSMLFTEAVRTVPEALTIARAYVGSDPSIILMPEACLTVPLLKA